jgi:ribosomal protein S18 acetylase RimI-like enzyme
LTANDTVRYARESSLGVNEFKRVLEESGLGTTRPVSDEARLRRMLSESNLIITARSDRLDHPLVGVARCLTDFSWCCYVSELAVSASAQGLGIGQGLLGAIRGELGPAVSVILVSVPDSVGFYRKSGMATMANAFCFQRER